MLKHVTYYISEHGPADIKEVTYYISEHGPAYIKNYCNSTIVTIKTSNTSIQKKERTWH